MKSKILTIFVAILMTEMAIPVFAQTGKTPTHRLTSSEDETLSISGNPRLSMLTNTSVAILRTDWFNKYYNPQNFKSPFPYAAIRLELNGDKESVDLAKERFSLITEDKLVVTEKDTKETNAIWFLVHCRNEYIDLDCGDGCEPINIWSNWLEPNKVYRGEVTIQAQ